MDRGDHGGPREAAGPRLPYTVFRDRIEVDTGPDAFNFRSELDGTSVVFSDMRNDSTVPCGERFYTEGTWDLVEPATDD